MKARKLGQIKTSTPNNFGMKWYEPMCIHMGHHMVWWKLRINPAIQIFKILPKIEISEFVNMENWWSISNTILQFERELAQVIGIYIDGNFDDEKAM